MTVGCARRGTGTRAMWPGDPVAADASLQRRPPRRTGLGVRAGPPPDPLSYYLPLVNVIAILPAENGPAEAHGEERIRCGRVRTNTPRNNPGRSSVGREGKEIEP